MARVVGLVGCVVVELLGHMGLRLVIGCMSPVDRTFKYVCVDDCVALTVAPTSRTLLTYLHAVTVAKWSQSTSLSQNCVVNGYVMSQLLQ